MDRRVKVEFKLFYTQIRLQRKDEGSCDEPLLCSLLVEAG